MYTNFVTNYLQSNIHSNKQNSNVLCTLYYEKDVQYAVESTIISILGEHGIWENSSTTLNKTQSIRSSKISQDTLASQIKVIFYKNQ